jgi:hypothetical protein
MYFIGVFLVGGIAGFFRRYCWWWRFVFHPAVLYHRTKTRTKNIAIRARFQMGSALGITKHIINFIACAEQ